MRRAAPSNILVTLIEGDSHQWPGLEIEELLCNGESAENEKEEGMLDDAIAPLFQPKAPGTYYLYGFSATYTQDYWGDVDADYELGGWRVATEEDQKQFYEESKL